MEKLKMQTKNKVDVNVETIGNLFPNTITERIKGHDDNNKPIIEKAIDFDILKQELSKVIVDGKEERYQMNWPGKKEAILRANSPINKTLRPCKEESVDFDKTENLYIEGDNLEVLKLLQETYLNKVKMIYIDPPYNTGKDCFVYPDNFAMSSEEFSEISGQYDEDGNINYDIRKNSENNGRFHTDWLNMMYPRLKLAKDLLKGDGVIFISIDDGEVDNLRKICNEIFGEANFVADLTVVNNLKGRNDKKYIARANERLLMYIKSDEFIEYGLSLDDNVVKEYSLEDEKGKYRLLELRKRGGADTRVERPNMYYPFFVHAETGEVSLEEDDYYNTRALPMKSNGEEGRWRWGKETASQRLSELYGKLVGEKYNIYEKDYLENEDGARRIRPKSVLSGAAYSTDVSTKEYRSIMGKVDFSNPKSVTLLSDLVIYATQPLENDIVLDFFSGSATTAHAVWKANVIEHGNRNFIMIQLPEKTDSKSEAYKLGYKNICEIGKERIRRAGKKIKEENPDKADSLDTGFRVLKLDSSNMKDVFYNPADFNQDMIDKLESNIKEDRSSEDLLFQVMLDLGELLSSDIKEIEIQGKKVFNVGQCNIIACFDDDINEDVVKEIAKMNPFYAVFRDSSLSNDSLATNFEQIFKTYSPSTIRKVL